MNIPTKENQIKELLKTYIEKKTQYDNLKKNLDELKEALDQNITEDRFDYEGVASFKRKASFTRKSLDNDKLKEVVPEEILSTCYKETEVKGAIEIVNWDTKELRKKQFKEKEQ